MNNLAAQDEVAEKKAPLRVLIIGDSISMQGYTKYAAETLKGEMLLHHHEGNSETSRNGLAKIDHWLAEAGGNWDIIHFNWGLWDLRHQGTHVPLAEYTANMEKLVARLKQTNATLIFATTTPVPPKNGMNRRDSDVEAYNAAVVAIAKREGIAVDDLYRFIKPTLAEHQRKNDVHFNQAGYKRMGESVVSSLRAAAKKLPTKQPPADAAETPNILMIVADDLGWADVAFHGGNAPTPHLDRLAQEGLELTQHYVAPLCSPTRAGLLTGRCWSRFGITTWTNTLGLPKDTVTLPRALQSKGYETCLVGKWHLGSLPKWGPNHFGFDHSYGSLAGGISPWNHRYKKGPYSITWHRNHELIEEPGHVTDLLTDEAVQWIKSHKSSPFFVYLPFTAVHLPVKEPKEWLARVPDTITGDVPRHYAASVMHLDDAVGRMIEVLEETGLRDNTLLVFTSDNGGSTAQNNDLKYPDDNCPNGRLPGNNHPLRGGKGNVYEGGTRVPTLVSWPARIKPGPVESPVQITDWMPTFCALAGFKPDRDLKWDGADITDLLVNRLPQPDRPLFTAGPNWKSSSLRYGDWKLITHGTGDQRRVELFNIAADPGESKNLADTEPKRVQELLVKLKQIAAADRDAVVK